MKKQSFTTRQLGVALAAFIFAANRFASFYSDRLQQDAWLAIPLGLLLYAPIGILYIVLAREFPGKGLFQIHEIVFGRAFGKMVTLLYVLYFIIQNAANQRYAADFTINTILPEMTIAPLLLSMGIAFVWLLRCGLQANMRITWFSCIVAMLTLGLSYALLAKQTHAENLLPVFRSSPAQYLMSAHDSTVISLGDIICFFPLLRYMKPEKKPLRPVVWGILCGSALTLLCVIQNTMVLGKLELYRNYPAFDVTRMIRLTDSFSRMEFLFTVPALLLIVVRVIFLFFAIVEGLGQIFNLTDYKTLFLPTVALCAGISFFIVSNPMELKQFTANIAPFFSGFFILLLPLLTLLLFLIRRRSITRCELLSGGLAI